MKDQKFPVIISIIALIISIIALLYSVGLLQCHCSCLNRDDDGNNNAQQEQVIAQDDQDGQGEEAISEELAEQESEPVVVQDQTLKKKTPTAAFIDLGLPSGTKWRSLNEPDLMTYDDAVAKYGKQLPTQKQFTELYEKCEWLALKNGGYKVVGPNGNYVLFPMTGFINCTGEFRGEKEFGDYWTATKKGDGEAWRVVFNDKGVKILAHTNCYARGIRLVEK